MKTKTKAYKPAVVASRPQGRASRSPRRSIVLGKTQLEKLKESMQRLPMRRTAPVSRPDNGRRPDLPRTGHEPRFGEANLGIVGTVVLQFGYHIPHSSYSVMLEKSGRAKVPLLSERKDFHHDKRKAVTGKQAVFVKQLNAIGILEQLEGVGFVLRTVAHFLKTDQTVVFEVTLTREPVSGKDKKPSKKVLEFVRKHLLPNIYYFVVVWQNPESTSGPASVNLAFSSGDWPAKNTAAELYIDGTLLKARRITAQ